MRRQLRRMGLSHDSRRSFATTDIEYVHWTQWIFLQVFNSWFDPEATAPDGSQGAARPITELIAKLESGEIRPEDGSDYNSLDRAAQAKIVDSFRLAYVSEAPVNWCPGLGTVLANEEVTADGRSERGNYPVFKRNLRQWMMRITAYGKRLSDDLDTINWPDKVRTMQRNWIGRSEGATVRFDVPGAREAGASLDSLDVYTTRPDTLFGATFMVVAPEHPILGGTVGGDAGDEAALTLPASWPEGTKDAWTGGAASPKEAVSAYRAQAAAKSEAERADEERTKTGVFTGLFGIDPVNGRPVPIFVADYVLWGYGTGAIMAVPAHDDRDWAFARAYDLDIVRTIGPADDPYGPDLEAGAYTGDGVAVDSANDEIDLNGLAKDEAKAAMIEWLVAKGLGHGTVALQSPALLGRALPDRVGRGWRRARPARGHASRRAARGQRLQPAHLRRGRRRLLARGPAGPRRGMGERHARPGRWPQDLPPRDQHDAPVGGLVLVRDALHRPDELRAFRRRGEPCLLDGPARGQG